MTAADILVLLGLLWGGIVAKKFFIKTRSDNEIDPDIEATMKDINLAKMVNAGRYALRTEKNPAKAIALYEEALRAHGIDTDKWKNWKQARSLIGVEDCLLYIESLLEVKDDQKTRDLTWGLLNGLVASTQDPGELSQIYFTMAQQRKNEKKMDDYAALLTYSWLLQIKKRKQLVAKKRSDKFQANLLQEETSQKAQESLARKITESRKKDDRLKSVLSIIQKHLSSNKVSLKGIREDFQSLSWD
jgi:hypothetical protein